MGVARHRQHAFSIRSTTGLGGYFLLMTTAFRRTAIEKNHSSASALLTILAAEKLPALPALWADQSTHRNELLTNSKAPARTQTHARSQQTRPSQPLNIGLTLALLK